jgi:hypothetical protein
MSANETERAVTVGIHKAVFWLVVAAVIDFAILLAVTALIG